MSFNTMPPEVLWAQRSSDSDSLKNLIYLTVRLVDPENLKINLTSDKLTVSAKSQGQLYDLKLEFFDDLNESQSRYEVTGSHLFFILFKKELKAEFWPRLTKEKLKYHYIHTDFDKWVDEDEQDEVDEKEELQQSMGDLNSFNSDQPIDFGELARQYGGQADTGAPPQYGDFGNAVDQFSSSEDEEDDAKVDEEDAKAEKIESKK